MMLDEHTKIALEAFIDTADRARPLIICDADEVLLQFFVTLEKYLEQQGFYVRLDSFALNGNIRSIDADTVASPETIGGLMQQFFKTAIHTSPTVDGAAPALKRLSQSAEICVLTNLPGAQADARQKSLCDAGICYPVICNSGHKGFAVKALRDAWTRPISFIDDLPPNHDSVAKAAPDVHRIHYVADMRLSKLIDKPASAHARLHNWSQIEQHLMAWLAQ
ncbi:MAG: hypothetical protein AAF862_05185 [Pseudomonadota bacterium]